jgi:hypothetical protein
MKTLLRTLALAGALTCAGAAFSENEIDKDCGAHGKVTVLTKDSITVDDQLFKVGDSTHVWKNGREMKLKDLKVGDFVCVDTRGKDDLDGQIAGVKILSPTESKHYREKDVVTHEHETVRDKTTEENE